MTRPNALLFAVLPWLLAELASGDEIRLRSGGVFSGEIVERTPELVVIDIGDGRITVPVGFVEQIVARATPRATYRARAAALAESDAPGWLSLGRWARDQGLDPEASSAFERVLRQDPENVTANLAAGRVRLGDRWVTEEESYRARGYVRFENAWMPPERRDEIQGQRAARAQRAELERARAESEARVREADARVREAEAQTQAALAQAQAAAARASTAESELAQRRSRADARRAAREPAPGTFTVCTVNGQSFFCNPPDPRACCYSAPGPGCFEPHRRHTGRPAAQPH